MIPIADENPKGFIPFINYLLIATNLAVFVFLMPESVKELENFYTTFGLIPQRLTSNPLNLHAYITIFTSMFLHGGLGHLLGNMLYLWIFGDNIEYLIGHRRYLIFYFTVGIAAAILQMAVRPDSAIPMVGASGAISGVLGAYLLKFPKNRVSILFFIIIIIRIIRVPAIIVLSIWFIFQLFSGYYSLVPGMEGGVAYFAHIGGFAAGFILIKIFERFPGYKH